MHRLFFAAAGIAAVMSAAQAAAPPRDILAGGQVRRNVSLAPWTRYEVINLNPDGTFSGNFQSQRPTVRGKPETRSGPVSGRWSVAGDQLCFEGTGLLYEGKNCYRMTKSGRSTREYSGTHMRTGDVWQFFVYPRGS